MLLSKVIPLAVVFVSGAWAQFDMAQCAAGNDWNKNSLNQDPCTVGSMLDASCRSLAEYTYPPLNASQYYLPPRTNHSGDIMCDCNTVMYSLYMACAACQGGQTYSWAQWVPQCTSVYITQYPIDIAQGTAVPHWAYYNITSLPNQTWNSTVAISVGRDPEQTPKVINTVSSGASGPKSTITKTGAGGPTGDADGDSKSNVGAIVGGVVGTVVPLTILAVAVFLYMRHRRQRAQQQPQTQYMPNPDEDPYKQRPMSYGVPPPMGHVPLYNPSDPSTFPPQSPPTSVTYTTPPNGARGTYSGHAEV
jgi:hypothetical protein